MHWEIKMEKSLRFWTSHFERKHGVTKGSPRYCTIVSIAFTFFATLITHSIEIAIKIVSAFVANEVNCLGNITNPDIPFPFNL
jgi:hypothetical protein